MYEFARILTSGVSDTAEMIAAITVPVVIFLIPIIAILTNHQRKMAEIIHGRHAQSAPQQEVRDDIANLRNEVHELKQLVSQQVIALDSMRIPPIPPHVSEEMSLKDRIQGT